MVDRSFEFSSLQDGSRNYLDHKSIKKASEKLHSRRNAHLRVRMNLLSLMSCPKV